MRRSQRALALAAIPVLALAFAAPVSAGGRPLAATPLLGANEAPNPGDPDATGRAWFTLNPGRGEICYAFEVVGADPLAAAHIHRAPAGAPGPIVVHTPPTSATGGEGCVEVARDLVLEIMADPSAFYFNAHNAAYPGGAVRAQLEK